MTGKSKTCRVCNDLLTDTNWSTSRQKRKTNICRLCEHRQNQARYIRKQDFYLSNMNNTRVDVRASVIEYYGSKCSLCNESNPKLMSLDHLDGNGRAHRKEVLGTDSGSQFYKWVAKNKPDNLRLLCFNCNCQRPIDQLPLTDDKILNKNIKRTNYRRANKIKCFDAYGGKCVNCNTCDYRFLTIDHIDGSGAEHRREVGRDIYVWLKNNNYPKDNYQLLCYNCNYLKHFGSLKQ